LLPHLSSEHKANAPCGDEVVSGPVGGPDEALLVWHLISGDDEAPDVEETVGNAIA